MYRNKFLEALNESFCRQYFILYNFGVPVENSSIIFINFDFLNFQFSETKGEFKVVTSATLDLMQTTSGRSQRDYEENRPTLAKCLDEFRKPELLEENNVYCQKCKCHTGAQKVIERVVLKL